MIYKNLMQKYLQKHCLENKKTKRIPLVGVSFFVPQRNKGFLLK